MKDHRVLMVQKLSAVPPKARLLFGLLISERLRGCCFAGLEATEAWSVYCDSIEAGYSMISEAQDLDLDQIAELQERIQEVVPDGGEPLQVQSQSALICLLETFRSTREDAQESIELLVNGVIDALDNYAFFVRRFLTGSKDCPESYMLLSRETQKQLDDLKYVQLHPKVSASQVTELREANLHYAVPIAIGENKKADLPS